MSLKRLEGQCLSAPHQLKLAAQMFDPRRDHRPLAHLYRALLLGSLDLATAILQALQRRGALVNYDDPIDLQSS